VVTLSMAAAPPRHPNDSNSAVRAPVWAAPTAAAVPAAPPPTREALLGFLDARYLDQLMVKDQL
jgi:hypothetical protein